MMPRSLIPVVVVPCALIAFSAFGQSNFTNQTSTRLIAASGVGSADPEEKDFTWGDYDHDDDIDLVSVRKSPFTSIGRRRNVLFMNEGIAQGHAINGVLVDRTVEFASEADDGGQGMLDLTDDRDVISVDVNSDGWMDIVTATTYGSGLAKSISHPRVYINQGAIGDVWQGFKYEQARIPQLGGSGQWPNFCGVGAGDVNGDKAPDLYFVDYDNIQTNTFEDRLLINDGNGFFTDETSTRVSSGFLASSFGTSAHIVDVNGDGDPDIVKSENGPIKTAYNNGSGFFMAAYQATYNGAAYHSSVSDLNGDGKLDIVASDDGVDVWLRNTGNNVTTGQVIWASHSFPASSSGFGATARFHDMNNDGFTDVFVCDVDVDAPGCSRVTKIFRNQGNYPTPTFTELTTGTLPATERTGVHDMAVIDLNQDTWKDLVIARCGGIKVWMQTPPSGLGFSYPQGLPVFLTSNTPNSFHVQVNGIGTAVPAPNSATLSYSINGSAYTTVPMTVVSGNLYNATIPPVNCTDVVNHYVSAQTTTAVTFRDPADAPTHTFEAVAADGSEVTLAETFETDVSAWSVVNHPSLTGGAWQHADPVGTLNFLTQAAPEDDAGNGADVKAFVTQDGAPGGLVQAADVDFGPTHLLSPTIDLAGTDATVFYSRWFYCEDAGGPDADLLSVEVSNNNGTNWVAVHSTGGSGGDWQDASFRVGQFVTPTNQVRVRFTTSDVTNTSITEAGIDNFRIEEVICDVAGCPADIAGADGLINVLDLLAVIGAWGPCVNPNDCPADVAPTPTSDDNVDVLDLLAIIGAWGPCQQ